MFLMRWMTVARDLDTNPNRMNVHRDYHERFPVAESYSIVFRHGWQTMFQARIVRVSMQSRALVNGKREEKTK